MMFRRSPKDFNFTSKHEHTLRDLTIDEHSPGTVLHDFDVLLTYIQERECSVTPGHQLRRRMLPEINARLARPIQTGLKRPLQKSFPHIHGLYLLARASGLTYVGGTHKKPLLIVDHEVYQSWQSLNPTERYCTLLEAWLLRGHPEIIGERGYGWARTPETFPKAIWFFSSIPDEGLSVAGDKEAKDSLRYEPEWHNLGLLDLFGLIEIHSAPPEPGKGWRIERIERTPLGKALLAALLDGFFGDIKNVLALESEDEIPYGLLQPALQPYFPQWQANLSIPVWEFRQGTHIFKVTLWKGIWRRIAIPADKSLDNLATVIINSVNFTHDHLYRFMYQNRFGVTEHYDHPFLEDGPWTNEARVGDIPLKVGHAMTFVYDFGDWWEFEVALESVDPELAIEEPGVLKVRGKPPVQYR